jgi:hypothetical protein
VGNWTGSTPTGFDKIGVYGRRAGGYTFELDLNSNGTLDTGDAIFAFGSGGRPIAGDWNNDDQDDGVGVFNGNTWFIDLNENQSLDLGETISTNFRGRPVVGDWTGTGVDRVGTYRNGSFFLDIDGDFQFNPDPNGNGMVDPGEDFAIRLSLHTSKQIPVAADWDQDTEDLNNNGVLDMGEDKDGDGVLDRGDTNLGIFVQDRNGQFPREAAEWYLDLGPFNNPNSPGDGLFQPPPTGIPGVPLVFQDIFYQFGDELSEPVVGNFDPPPPGGALPSNVQPLPPAPPADHSNARGPQASPIIVWDVNSSTVESGDIETRKDRDVFRFTPTETGRIAIDVTTANSDLNSVLEVRSATGRRLARNDNFGEGTDSHVELQVIAGETYYVTVGGARRTTGEYDLALEYILGGPLADDHGGNARTATQLALDADGSATATGTIHAGDLDVFKFTASASGVLELNLAGQSGFTPLMDVYDPAGRRMPLEDSMSLQVEAGNTYYIRVRALGGMRGDYELALDLLLESVV